MNESENPFAGVAVDHSNRAVQELLDLLASMFYFPQDIEDIVKKAKVPPGRIPWGYPPYLLWPKVIDVAHGHQRLDSLFGVLRERAPGAASRIDNLLSDEPVLAAPPGPQKASWRGGDEIQTGAQSALLDMQFLHMAIEAASAVCKLTVQFPAAGEGWGTGFLIAPDLVLTNRHVLFDENHDRRRTTYARAEFFYETGKKPVSVMGVVEKSRFHDQHDCAILHLTHPVEGVRPLRLQPHRAPCNGEPAFIVQHPGGGPKKLGLYRNEIKLVDSEVVQYLTDTDRGSSGSPVCNKDWEVIALHHRWIQTTESRGPNNLKIISQRNQGVRIQHVVDWLETLGVPLGPEGKA